MSRSVFWFEKRTRTFAKKWRNFKYFLQFRDEKRNPKVFSLVSRREREILQTNLMIREEIETSRFQIFVTRKRNPPFPFLFFSSVLKTQNKIFATRGVLTPKSRIKIVCLTIPSPKCNDH